MFIKKIALRTAGASLAAIALLAAHPLRAESSENAQIEKLEQAVQAFCKNKMPS